MLTLVPAIAIMAAPAFAQSSVSSSESVTTSGAVVAPSTETVTKKETRTDDSMPIAENHESKSYERKTTSDGMNSSTEVEKHKAVQGADGSYSEKSSTTTSTGPQ
jgi:hypothetical protein